MVLDDARAVATRWWRTLSAAVTLVVLAGGAAAAETEKPNFLFIVVDDMGYADLGCYGSEAIHTPHVDRLAEQGMRFTDAYSGCTVCAPARSTLMTGYDMGRTPVRANPGGVALRRDDVTVAEALKKAGYATGGFGKWGLGNTGSAGAAEKQGFDTFVGYYNQVHAHYYYPLYLIDTGKKLPLPGNRGFYEKHKHRRPAAHATEEDGRTRRYSHNVIFERTKQFIREHKDEPFFCYAPWTPPHGEYKIPRDDPAWARYKDKDWSTAAKVVAAMDTMVDRHVGELLALLRELGLENDTVVVFASDNGAARRFEGTLDSSGPFRGKKRAMYEGGLRVPFVVRWPGQVPAGRVSDLPIYFADVAPTLAEWAGATEHLPDDLDGMSLVPTLTGRREEQPSRTFLYWEFGRYDGQGKLRRAKQAVRMDDWKAVRQRRSQPWELYDLRVDPGEQTNVAKEHPDVVRAIDAYAKAHREPAPSQKEPPRGIDDPWTD